MTTAVHPTVTKSLRRAAVRATRAPSVHNTQPWRFVIRNGTFELNADRTRQLRVLDPRARQMLMSCGCALFNARVALAAAGVVAQVDRLPDPARPDLVADPAYRAELRSWTTNDAQRLDGVHASAVAHVDGHEYDEMPMRDFDSCGEGWLPADTHSSARQCLLLLGTEDDGPYSWLRAGEALERVLLEVARLGYSASPVTQVIEVPQTHEALRVDVGIAWHPHLTWAHNYVTDEVHNQLAAQKIFFPPKDSPAIADPEYAAMRQYAGRQLTTGDQAEVYADHFIANHLKEIGGGKTYAQLSSESLADPTNEKLAQTVQTMFRGETLRGLLLNAYAFGKMATIAGWAALASFIGAAVLLIFALLGLWHSHRVPRTEQVFEGRSDTAMAG